MLTRIGHIALHVKDLEAAVVFQQQVMTNTVVEGSEGYLVPDAGWEAAWVH